MPSLSTPWCSSFRAAVLAAIFTIALPSTALAQSALKADPDGGAKPSLTAEQRKALLEAMRQQLRDDDAGLKATVRGDGTEILDLQGRFQSVAVARKENGRTVTGCVTSPAEAAAFADGATPHAHADAKPEVK